MTDSYEAAVVGGGIVGTATAFHLADAGVDALLVDADREGRATDAGAGIVSPASSSRRGDDDWFRLGVASADHYRHLVDRLETAGVERHGFRESDLLSVCLDESDREGFEADLARIRNRSGAADGVADAGAVDSDVGRGDVDADDESLPAGFSELDGDEAASRCPALGDVDRALLVEDAAQVDGRQFTRALRRLGREAGLSTREATVEELVVADGGIGGVVADGERIDCENVVVAGGAWSAEFGASLGVDVPVEPKRGQIAHLDAGERTPATDAWPILTGYRGHYLVPWRAGHVAVGATREAGSGFDPRATAAGVREVLDEALALAPGLEDATFSEVRVGLRPSTPDGLPVLGAVPDVDGAFLATGHGPTGLTLGPYSGKAVADLVRGESPAVGLGAFSVERFR